MKLSSGSTGLAAVGIAAAFIATSAIALPAFAEDGGSANGQIHVEVQMHTEDGTTSVSGESEMHASATSSRGDEQGDARSSGADDHGNATSSERNKGQEGSAKAEEHAQSEEGQEHAGGMEFDRDSIDVHATSTTKIDDAKKVRTESDLADFSAGVFEHNPHITHIAVSTSSVATDANTPARLLGFIPTTIPTHVQVSKEGEVTVSFPWYAFLFATGHGAIQDALASSTASVGTQASLSAQAQANVVQAIVGALQSLFSASASGSASASQ